MNEEHLRICASAEWAEYVETQVLPWAIGEIELGEDVLEVGPGPGMTTNVLRRHVVSLTAIELDPGLARELRERMAGCNVEVVVGDATSLPFEDGRFSSAVCFTMLHHVPTPELQDRLLAEMSRVVRPGGWALGVDGTDTPERRALHVGDVFNPVDPGTLPSRLERAGFEEVAVEVRGYGFRFAARAAAH